MATTPTNNAVPSESPRDLKFNAGKIDEFVNQMAPNFKYTDRFGNEHLTIAGIENLVRQIVSSLGFVPLGTFEGGATLTDATQTLKYEADGNYYRWDGDFDKVVPTGSTPYSTGGVEQGAWVNVTDLTLRASLSSIEEGLGDNLVSHLRDGVYTGTVRDYLNKSISHVTLEILGYSADVSGSASDALDAFHDLAKSGVCTKLVLAANVEYVLTRNHKFNVPLTIEGGSAVFIQSGQYGGSVLKDGRGANADGFLLEFANGDDKDVLGYNLSGFQVLGNKADGNQGLLFSAAGWTNSVSNILIRNFGKQGIAFLHVNDSTYDHLQVLGCGGFVDGFPYYAVDMLPNGTAQTGWVNNSLFNRLHIEHSRYALRLACWFVTFVAAHIEKGSTFSATSDMSPMINVGPIARPVNFIGCNFISPRWEDYIPAGYDTSNPSAVLDAIPAMFDTTYSNTDILVLNEYQSRIKFDGCNFTTTSGNARYFKCLYVPLDIIGCHFTNLSMYRGTPPALVGPRSTVSNNFFILVGVTGDTSVFAEYVNGVFSPAVYQQLVYGTFTGNTFILNGFSGTSIAAIVAGTPASCFSSGNKIVGFTNLFSGLSGEQIQNGLRVRTTSNALDVGVNGLEYNANTFFLRTTGTNSALYTVFDNSDSAAYCVRPSTESSVSNLGSSSLRWNTLYAKTGTINTSDRRSKTDETEISEIEKRVSAKMKGLIRRFRYIDGESDNPNKLRFGVIAQDVVAAFESEGLNAEEYGVVQHDSWDALGAVYDEQGSLISEARAAGDRYGVNYSELLCFIISAM